MSFTEPSKQELEFLAIILRLGGHPSLEKVRIKSRGKGVDLNAFMEEWGAVIKVQSDGNTKRVIILVEEVRRILAANGTNLIDHHSQPSRRWLR